MALPPAENEVILKLRLCRNLRRVRPLVALAAAVALVVVYGYYDYTKMQKLDAEYYIKDYNYTNTIVEKKLQESLLEDKGRGCQMPVLDPLEAADEPFADPPQVVCSGFDWVQCYKSKCSVVKSILETMRDVVCSYRDIIYVNDQVYYKGDPARVYGGDDYTLNRSDHVHVSCKANPISRVSLVSSRWFGYKTGFRPVPKRPQQGGGDSLNVLLLIFDSASHFGFARKMPKSYKVLQDKAVIMNSYNIVGDGTPCALFPILSGRSDLEHPDTRQALSAAALDPRALIFHLLNQRGYRTAYFEDMPWIGTFTYRYNGFAARPADHYLRALLLDESKRGAKMWYGYKRRYCFGSVPQYSMMLNLTNHFFELDGNRFCLTFIADITHNDINMMSAADGEVARFIQNFTEGAAGRDTLLLVMGDHGPRYSYSRTTYQSKLEERLPLVAVVLPEQFKKRRPDALDALKGNADVLTTPYDIHTTLLDFMDLSEHANPYTIPGADYPRGLSLLKPVAGSRSCSAAGVMRHWCACARWRPLPARHPLHARAALALAAYIDHITADQRSLCAPRRLVRTEWVVRLAPDARLLRYRFVKEEHRYLGNTLPTPLHRHNPTTEHLQAKIVLSPGNSEFEGTMTYNVKKDKFQILEREISRTNKYGDEPRCLSGNGAGGGRTDLNKYCYCKHNSSLFNNPL